jgi:hypothetical protein
MTLICLAFKDFLPRSAGFRDGPGKGRRCGGLPTAIHSVRALVTKFVELPTIDWRSSSRLNQPEGVVRTSDKHSQSGLPKQVPVGTTYVVEGRGGANGELRVFSRYLVLPSGRRINVPGKTEDRPVQAPLPRRRKRRFMNSSNDKRRAARTGKKIVARDGTPHRRTR